MAQRRTQPDKDAPPTRRMRGFEPAATLLAAQLRQGAESRGFAVARLLTHWAEIVGPETAAHTRPVRIAHGRGIGATLTVLTDGAHAPLIQMQLPQIRERVNAVYGFNAIVRVSVTQTAALGFAEGQAEFLGAGRAAAAPAPSAADAEAAGRIAARFADEGLAGAIRALALNRAARRSGAGAPMFQDRKANP